MTSDALNRSLPPSWTLGPDAGYRGAPSPAARPLAPVVRRPRVPGGLRTRPASRVSPPLALAGLLAGLALPVVAWHGTVASVADRFSLSPGYLLTGWSGYVLIALGLMLMAPVALTVGLPVERRPRSRGALLSWGIVLYLLGLALASQVAAISG